MAHSNVREVGVHSCRRDRPAGSRPLCFAADACDALGAVSISGDWMLCLLDRLEQARLA